MGDLKSSVKHYPLYALYSQWKQDCMVLPYEYSFSTPMLHSYSLYYSLFMKIGSKISSQLEQSSNFESFSL